MEEIHIWRDKIEPSSTNDIWYRLNKYGDFVGWFKYKNGKWVLISRKKLKDFYIETGHQNIIDSVIDSIVDGAPEEYNTLKELADGKLDTASYEDDEFVIARSLNDLNNRVNLKPEQITLNDVLFNPTSENRVGLTLTTVSSGTGNILNDVVFEGNILKKKFIQEQKTSNLGPESTNDEYPTAKAVYDKIQELEKKISDAELLNTPLTFEFFNGSGDLYFKAPSAGNEKTIKVSTDGGKTWESKTSGADTPTLIASINDGDNNIVLIKATNDAYGISTEYGNTFSINGDAYVYGNIMSLVNENNFANICSVSNFAFSHLFGSCNIYSHPTKSILLPAVILGEGCYASMFTGCSHLTTMPELPATNLANSCYYHMFDGGGLKTLSKLPATKLKTSCYEGMFSVCNYLKHVEKDLLPATELAEACYKEMFANCFYLENAPDLPSIHLQQECYYRMFASCTALTIAPKLPALFLASQCYYQMFYLCNSLNHIEAMFLAYNENNVHDWVTSVSATGTFVMNGAETWEAYGNSGIPMGWIIKTDVSYSPLCFEQPNDSTASISIVLHGPSRTLNISYDGIVWETNQSHSITLNSYERRRVFIISNDTTIDQSDPEIGWGSFNIVQRDPVYVYGNVMSLIAGFDFITCKELDVDGIFMGLFSGSHYIINHPTKDIILPATTLSRYCYRTMFMYCDSLTRAPELPATTLTEGCYNGMFFHCGNLTKAPELLATELAPDCYESMFSGCSQLNYIKAMFTDTLYVDYEYNGEIYTVSATDNWLHNTSTTGTFIKNPNATWNEVGSSGVPEGWNIEFATE